MRYVAFVAALLMFGAPAPVSADRKPRPSDYAAPFTPGWAAPQLVVTPEYGAPGMQVQISGATFHRGVQVFYGDRPMEILAVGKRDIIAVIPWHARHHDFIYVVDSTGRARTAVPFALEYPRHYRRY